MKKILLLLSILLTIHSCILETSKGTKKVYTYIVINKSKDIESVYTLSKGHTLDMVEKLVVKDSLNNVFIIRDECLYYKYNIGDTLVSDTKFF